MGEERIRGAAGRNSGGNGGDKIDAGKTDAKNQGGESSAGNAAGGNAGGNAAGGNADASAAAAAAAVAAVAPVAAKSGNNTTVNPASLAPDEYERDETGAVILNADGSPRKKRGRKPGKRYNASSTSAPKSKPARSDAQRAAVAVEMLAAQFQILNAGIAFITKFEDFALDDSEAMKMAEATANVMAQFDYVPDPKIAAVLGLVTTTGMIYGPRVYLYRKWLTEKREEKRKARIAAADEAAANRGPGFDGPLNMGQFSG